MRLNLPGQRMPKSPLKDLNNSSAASIHRLTLWERRRSDQATTSLFCTIKVEETESLSGYFRKKSHAKRFKSIKKVCDGGLHVTYPSSRCKPFNSQK